MTTCCVRTWKAVPFCVDHIKGKVTVKRFNREREREWYRNRISASTAQIMLSVLGFVVFFKIFNSSLPFALLLYWGFCYDVWRFRMYCWDRNCFTGTCHDQLGKSRTCLACLWCRSSNSNNVILIKKLSNSLTLRIKCVIVPYLV